jgi:hypothetical protein
MEISTVRDLSVTFGGFVVTMVGCPGERPRHPAPASRTLPPVKVNETRLALAAAGDPNAGRRDPVLGVKRKVGNDPKPGASLPNPTAHLVGIKER